MTDAPYLFIGDHADVLASGRPLTPGEEVPADAIDPDADQRLLDDGLLVAQTATGSRRRRAEKDQTPTTDQEG